MAQQSGEEPGREYSAIRREALTLPMDRPRANDAREEQQTQEDTQGDSTAGKAPEQADPQTARGEWLPGTGGRGTRGTCQWEWGFLLGRWNVLEQVRWGFHNVVNVLNTT